MCALFYYKLKFSSMKIQKTVFRISYLGGQFKLVDM